MYKYYGFYKINSILLQESRHNLYYVNKNCYKKLVFFVIEKLMNIEHR